MRRRHFLTGAGAGLAGLAAAPLWADITGAEPLYLSAANTADNATWLVGLTLDGTVRFAHPLPGRGHAAAVHPERAEAVAFARRPGDFALVIDCATGDEIARLTTPADRHFYGHGAYTADGSLLLTTENAFDVPDGRIGLWDAANGYARLGEFPSGGIGPHEVLRLASGDFAVANGGIQTHPDFERAKLNLPTMQTNLTILNATGTVTESWAFEGEMRQNSIRHIDVDAQGRIVAALQWQGDPREAVPLVARFTPGGAVPPAFLDHPATATLTQYAGSIAVSRVEGEIAVTGPKGNHVVFFGADGAPDEDAALGEASGVAPMPDGLAITCTGGLALYRGGQIAWIEIPGGYTWDNHLVRVG